MHIVFVTETWPPQVNGVAFTVRALALGLATRGHRVEVVRPGKQGNDGKVELLSARGAPPPRYPGLQVGMPQGGELRRRWCARRPDVVYIATEGLLGISAMRVANALQVPVATGFHTRFHDYAAHYGVGLLAPLVRSRLMQFHRRAQMTLVPTRALLGELREAGIRHVRKLRRGVDTDLFTPARRDAALRESWGVEGDTPVMLCVGRLAAEKGLGLALQAFRALQARVPAARIVMVGDGPQRGALADAYPDVIFAGTKHGEELAAHYASADLFLFPSLTETFGNVVLEAMASGLAVVAFDRAAAQEHVANGISGLVIPATDARGFITSACELGWDAETRRMLGTNARIVAEQCAPDAVTAEFEKLLHALVREHGHDPVGAAA
ncbi:MAG: Glycosyltransferase [Rhodanobacteraceae bacterium]|jgi:glycosyltransferase involved in cell wall biosynthesis|nr:MAG: Glycosyltransferase [Rhodanobacteraceae bacterium]